MKTIRCYLLVLFAGIMFGGCSRMQADDDFLLVHNGFVLGDRKHSQPLVVGVGDSVSRLRERNSFLRGLSLPPREELRLPLLMTTDFTYDDGHWKLKIGCVTTSNLDGGERILSVQTIGLDLCEPALNDWKSATRRAAALVEEFRIANPDARDISSWLRGAKESELRAIGGKHWMMGSYRTIFKVQEADAYFAMLAGMSTEEAQRQGLDQGVTMGTLMG